MNILVILGHPKKNSFNHAIAQKVIKTLQQLNHEVIYHDLYFEKFDPILKSDEIEPDAKTNEDIEKHCKELAASEGIVIIHPNWWGQPPAILKGWIDRVLRDELAYRFEETDSGEGIPVGLLKAKKAVIFNTSNTEEKREQTYFKDPLEILWKKCIFDLCGVKNVHRRMFSVVITSTKQLRESWLEEVAQIIQNQFPKNNN